MRWPGMWHILEAGAMHLGSCWGNLREEDQLEDLGLEYNINMNLQHLEFRGMDWIALAQERDSWRALVNAVMNLRVPSIARILLTS